MKNAATMLAAVVMVVVVGVANGLPLNPEPRQFVYQPGSPSVRLYPVHFEHYLKSATGRVHLTREGSPVMQVFRPNMLQPEPGKTERPSDTTTPLTTTMRPVTTTTTTTTTTTSTTPSAPTTPGPMITKGPMMEIVTTLQPQPMMEAEEDSVPELHTHAPTHDLDDAEPVTEAEMMLEGDSSVLVNADEEAVSVTETMPVMEGEEVEAATQLPHDETEATHGREGVDDDTTVTEMIPENEIATELPDLRELEGF